MDFISEFFSNGYVVAVIAVILLLVVGYLVYNHLFGCGCDAVSDLEDRVKALELIENPTGSTQG